MTVECRPARECADGRFRPATGRTRAGDRSRYREGLTGRVLADGRPRGVGHAGPGAMVLAERAIRDAARWSRWTGALGGRYCVLASIALLADVREILARRINASRLQRG